MADCPKFKIDSNDTGLRYAVEECLKQLPENVVWHAQEPNSYGDFGATITTVARNPINPSRQRKKGVVTDKEASASFTTDFTNGNHIDLMQGFMFAAARQRPTTKPIGGTPVVITAVAAADGYAMVSATANTFKPGMLVLAQGFGVPANNGLKTVGAVAGGKVTVDGTADEASPPATASLTVVGMSAAAGAISLTVAGGLVTLVGVGMDTFGVVPGEWVFIGGDAVNSQLAKIKGFARVKTISPTGWVLDKYTFVPEADSGAGKSVQVMLGIVIKNESDPLLIKRFSYQFERTLGRDADGAMSQYVIGAVANEFTLNVEQTEKVTGEMGFVACDSVARSGAVGLKPGTRPPLVSGQAYNTSSDVRRISFGIVGDSKPLFVYATDMTLTIGNNASGAKAIGVLGNFDINVGTFDVGGSVTAYFQDVRAVNAVNDNADVTMDVIMVTNNSGIVYDVPLLALGNGMISVEQDQSVTVPLDTMAAESEFGHTLMYVNFPYLPSIA